MLEKQFKIQVRGGLHARPASQIVNEALKYDSDIYISLGDERVSAKSIIRLMGLNVRQGQAITLHVKGPDEGQALQAIQVILDELK